MMEMTSLHVHQFIKYGSYVQQHRKVKKSKFCARDESKLIGSDYGPSIIYLLCMQKTHSSEIQFMLGWWWSKHRLLIESRFVLKLHHQNGEKGIFTTLDSCKRACVCVSKFESQESIVRWNVRKLFSCLPPRNRLNCSLWV